MQEIIMAALTVVAGFIGILQILSRRSLRVVDAKADANAAVIENERLKIESQSRTEQALIQVIERFATSTDNLAEAINGIRQGQADTANQFSSALSAHSEQVEANTAAVTASKQQVAANTLVTKASSAELATLSSNVIDNNRELSGLKEAASEMQSGFRELRQSIEGIQQYMAKADQTQTIESVRDEIRSLVARAEAALGQISEHFKQTEKSEGEEQNEINSIDDSRDRVVADAISAGNGRGVPDTGGQHGLDGDRAGDS